MGKRVKYSSMDRFSNLPEPIIHRIMSLLPTENATRMSILSKTFYSSWRSFPIMDFDYHLFNRNSIWDEKYKKPFFDFLESRLIKMQLLKNSLEKLSFYGFPCYKIGILFLRMINFSIQNNVKEVELQFKKRSGITYWLPPAIFSANSIKILTLKEVDSVSQDLILSCPCLENFNLINCHGFKSVTFASNTKLIKDIRIEGYLGIKHIHFESPALCLESFSCCANELDLSYYREPLIFNISSSTTPNLKHLQLRRQCIPDGLIESGFAEFPYLETLKIQSCSASKKLIMIKFRLEYLKTLEFCYDNVKIQTSSNGPPPPEIDISRCTNLKHVEFRGEDLPYRWIRNSCFYEFRFLETLKLEGSSASKKIKFHFEYLKILELQLRNVDQVEIQAPSMVSFSYRSFSSAQPPEIDISSSYTTLKHLRFDGGYIPDIWVKHNFSQFLSLEILELLDCGEMKEIKLRLENLESLKLSCCREMSQLEIEAPNLVSISYKGTQGIIHAPDQVIITSKAKLDHVKLDFYSYQLDHNYYISLRNFIERFAQHCQTLTLHCSTRDLGFATEYIYPEELRKVLDPPLYNLEHLEVEIDWLKNCILPVELIDSLLWLAPHPNRISFATFVESQVRSLKFQYRYENLESWKDDLKKVTMVNFTDHGERTIIWDHLSETLNF